MDIFEKWNESTDLKGLQNDIKDAQENKREYDEIPHGEYEVKVDKMELKASKKGDPMVSIWFTILEGKYKKSKLFLNQVITQGFQIHIVNELLKSMGTDLVIVLCILNVFLQTCKVNVAIPLFKHIHNNIPPKKIISPLFLHMPSSLLPLDNLRLNPCNNPVQPFQVPLSQPIHFQSHQPL